MRIRIGRWDTGLGVRIPKDIAGRAGLSAGARVEIGMEGDRIVISPRPHCTLDELLRGMTPEAMHEAFDWGAERGREAVDE